MSTSLKRQLAALAAPASSLIVPDRRRSSIIFTSQDAAKYDKETFYQIGRDGLSELISINPVLFRPFLDSMIFAESSKKCERIMEDKEENDELNQVIQDFLLALHPYLLMKAALKCLEWLVYRFHIERFNVDAILQCVLPYYDTKPFVMIVQVLEIERFQENRGWEWLVHCKQSGAPLRKSVLFDNSNSQFILWLFTTFEELLRVQRGHPENLRIYLGFMASTIVGILNKLKSELVTKPKKVDNQKVIGLNILNKIFDLLTKIREDDLYEKYKNDEEIYSMAYVVMTMVAVCCREIPGMADIVGPGLRPIFKLISVNRGATQRTETFLLLNLMIDLLNREWQFKRPKTFKNVMHDLSIVSEKWDLSNLATQLILHNVKLETIITPLRVLGLVSEIEMRPEARSEILRQVYQHYRKVQTKRHHAKTLLVSFERQYPLEFELASKKDASLSKDLAKFKSGKDFIYLSGHANASVRAQAVQKLIKKSTLKKSQIEEKLKKKKQTMKKSEGKPITPDKNKIALALAPRFADDDASVLLNLLKPKVTKLLRIFSPKSLSAGIFTTLKRTGSIKASKMAMRKLCDLAQHVQDSNATVLQEIVVFIVPFLFPKTEKQLKLSRIILSSEFAKENPILKQYNTVLNNPELKAEDITKESFRLITLLDDEYKKGLFCTLDTAIQATFACILLPEDKIFSQLLSAAQNMDCKRCTSFPVDETNFSKCVRFSEKRQQLSLELVLTGLCRVPTNNFEKLFTVLKFVWKNAERIENRDSCMLFLKKYFKACFKDNSEQLTFWLQALRVTLTGEDEFFMIRTIQFASAFVKESNFTTSSSTNIQPKRGRPRKSVAKSSSDDQSFDFWELIELILTLSLPHESNHVRSFGLKFLRIVKDKLPEKDVFTQFINDLLEYEIEIKTDPEQVGAAMSYVLTDNKSLIKSKIVESLTQENLEEARKIGLLKLCTSVSSKVFKEVYPSSKQIMEINPGSKYLLHLLNFYDGTFDEKLLNGVLQYKEPAKVILKRIDRNAYDSYNLNEKKKILSVFIDKTLACKCPETRVAILRCVRKWTLDAIAVTAELNKCLELEKRAAIPRPPNAKITKDGPKEPDEWISRAEVVLEFIQGKKRITNKTKMIKPLFKILQKCISLEEQIPVEYIKQLVLTSLTMCCQDDEELDKEEANDFATFDVQTVIDCLRCSRNPQTHHHALILLNYAASRYHEQVLHGIMSLFAFMGNSILRQDDSYSIQLIQQTLVNIIPALARPNKEHVERLSISAGIFRVITSVMHDIPAHRRLPVFTSLTQTLEPERTMWQLCIILVDNALEKDRKRSTLNAYLELAVDLVWSFSPTIAAKTVEQMYSFLTSLPIYLNNPTPEQFGQLKTRQNQMERKVLDYSRKEGFKDVLMTVHYSLELIAQICGKFAGTELENEEVEYDSLLERCLTFSRKVSGLNEEKLFRFIIHKNMEVIDKVNAALDPLKFIEAVALILVRDDVAVKRKMIEFLNQRILQKIEWFGDLENLLDLVPLLIEIADIEPDSYECTTLVQTAFNSLKLLAKYLAVTHPDNFVPVFQLATKHSEHDNKLLRASSLLCLSELFSLKSLILPNLNKVTSSILKAFKASAKLQIIGQDETAQDLQKTAGEGENSSLTAHLLCSSTMTCLNKMIEHLGSFVGMKFLKKVLIAVLSINSSFGEGDKASHRSKVFEQKLKALLKVISTKIPLRNITVPLRASFSSLANEPTATITLMKILKDGLIQTPKADFTLIVDSIMDGFLEDFLTVREKNENPDIEGVEDAVIDCLISGIVLKMTESHFRPIYHKIFDWAKGNDVRLVTFYRLSATAAERLKSLFVTFVGYATNEAVQVVHKNVDLAKAIIRFFYYVFSNDKEGFVTTDRFNALVQPLLDFIESEFVLSGQISITQVNDCLIQLAVATNDLNRWQHLIELIGLKASHSNKHVRLNVLLVLEATANELAKDFLPLLPPAVPFLAELMNDDDPEVEAETQKLLLKLENIVGEPLQSYFTS